MLLVVFLLLQTLLQDANIMHELHINNKNSLLFLETNIGTLHKNYYLIMYGSNLEMLLRKCYYITQKFGLTCI